MRRQCLRIVIALIAVAVFGIGVKAQVLDQIEVNIPYQFVVAGKTLPAGTYGETCGRYRPKTLNSHQP